MTLEELKKLHQGDKVVCDGEVRDFGYISQTDKAVLYEEGARNMQDSIAVAPERVSLLDDQALDKRIKAIPNSPNGFWKSASEDTYIEVGHQLKARGMSDNEVVDVLETLYWAAASCYGA
jgi:hypothetical protein